MRKYILFLLLSFICFAFEAEAQDPRDNMIGCYYCDIARYDHGIHQEDYSKDTVQIEKNDTISDGLNVYFVCPGALSYDQFDNAQVWTNLSFYGGVTTGIIVQSDSLYLQANYSSYWTNKFKCKRVCTLLTGINSTLIFNEVRIDYRNENKQLYISAPQANNSIYKVFNLNGIEVLQQSKLLQQGINTIYLDGLRPGMYVVLLNVKEKQYVQKIVVY